MSTSGYIPRTQELNDALDKFHNAFIDMLVGKTKAGEFVDKPDMYKAMQAVVSLLFLFMWHSTPHVVCCRVLLTKNWCDAMWRPPRSTPSLTS